MVNAVNTPSFFLLPIDVSGNVGHLAELWKDVLLNKHTQIQSNNIYNYIYC